MMVSSLCCAQHSDHCLYQAYLEQDLSIWEQYVASCTWDDMTVDEKKRLLNYEYGLAAYLLGHDVEEARVCIGRFQQHIEDMQDHLPTERYCAYLAGLYTYQLGLNHKEPMRMIKGIFDNVKRAMDLNDQDPFVVAMQANVEFYSPFGSKRKALKYFQLADSLYNVKAESYERWNKCAVKINIVQCLDKMGKQQEAIEQCKQFLDKESDCILLQEMMENLYNNQ